MTDSKRDEFLSRGSKANLNCSFVSETTAPSRKIDESLNKSFEANYSMNFDESSEKSVKSVSSRLTARKMTTQEREIEYVRQNANKFKARRLNKTIFSEAHIKKFERETREQKREITKFEAFHLTEKR